MQFLREPLLHFLLIGAGFFALYIFLNPDAVESDQTIVVDTGRINTLAESFKSTWNRNPTETELNNLIEDFVLEEIYYRQALAMGIDKNDVLIRRRLRQKMEFLSTSMAASIQPADSELQTYLDANAEKYRTPSTYSFEQIYINPDKSAEALDKRLAEIAAVLADNRIAEGDQTLLARRFNSAPSFQIDSTFGRGFSTALDDLPVNEWSEPVQSGLGTHYVKITEHNPGYLPPLEEVREQVLRDWSYEKNIDIKSKIKDNLLAEYQVVVEWSEGTVN